MQAAPEPLGSRRDEFDVPPGVAYFNTASLCPLTHRVRAAGADALERRARPWAIASADWFSDVEILRGLFAGLIGGDAEGVALVPATSYGFAAAALNLDLGDGDRILVLAEEYPSGINTWRAARSKRGVEIVTVERAGGQSWTEAILAALDERITVVSVPNVHWTDGALIELDVVSARAHELGCTLIIDASQSAGALPLDVTRLDPDYLITVGYKWLLGAFGLSYMYVAERRREGEPLEHNWIARADSQDFARLVEYRDEFQPGARRFDMGQASSFHLVPMAIAALEQIGGWGVERISATLGETTAAIAAGAQGIGLAPLSADSSRPAHAGHRAATGQRRRARRGPGARRLPRRPARRLDPDLAPPPQHAG